MEMLCGFNIINNNGFNFLENVLYRNVNGRGIGFRGELDNFYRITPLFTDNKFTFAVILSNGIVFYDVFIVYVCLNIGLFL